MAGRIRLAVANAATRERAAGVSVCGGGDADGPLRAIRCNFSGDHGKEVIKVTTLKEVTDSHLKTMTYVEFIKVTIG